MKADSAWNMFVFRDGRRTVAGATLVRAIANALTALENCSESAIADALVNGLLLAGELECALTDAASPEAFDTARVTDALADRLLGLECGGIPGHSIPGHSSSAATLSTSELKRFLPMHPPRELKVSPPEGFAYYALHPLDFADCASTIPLNGRTVCVIGIRSIGVTLSALVLAAVRRRGLDAQRLSVRPFGHPYDRKTEFTAEQARVVQSLRERDAEFLVVDEGPGMSGSSFLSVGEALTAAGVRSERVTFLGSRVPDPDALRATDAGRRWRTFRSCYARQNSRLPHDATVYVGGGEWRQLMLSAGSQWPASWTQMERLKFFSPDHSNLFKFEGFGRFGQSVHDRAQHVAAGGFGPTPLAFSQGFSVYPLLQGRTLRAEDLTPALLDRMADYCAFRASEFRTDELQNAADLETMVRFNVSEEFGYELPLEPGSLFSDSPVLVDGRMLPHEWIETSTADYQKVDTASHGDDHFFPGPTDIGWDLAGAIVEWNLTREAQQRFLDRYRRSTGDDPTERIGPFMLAYSVFRCGYCLMAAEAVRGSGEEHRLLAAHDRYRAVVESCLPQSLAA